MSSGPSTPLGTGNGNGNGLHPRYPGVPTITDGSGAVVWVEINITQAACAYPITSSTVMGGGYSAAVSNGQKNLWGEKLLFIEPESERSSAACQTPFMNVQDGFLITHTNENVLLPEKEFMLEYMGRPQDRIINLFDVDHPMMTGVVQDQDSYMKGKIAQRHYYAHMKPAV